jgi:hypothetical protein
LTAQSTNLLMTERSVNRLARVLQQLHSLGELHAAELASLADELEQAGQPQLAERVRTFARMQRSENQLVQDELRDIRAELAASLPPAADAPDAADPAAHSPRRARWLAEQQAQAEAPPQPLSRRDLLSGDLTPEE